MKRLVALWLLLGAAYAGGAQDTRFVFPDESAVSFPKDVTTSTLGLARYIRENYTTDLAKIGAAYRWITANIRYDKDSMLAINWSKESDEKIAATLRRKKGVCDNFASVFTDVLLKMNIPSFVVNGHCKTTGAIFNQSHSWSAVRVSKEWLLCDPTWDLMYSGSPRFYLIAPGEFIETHWPFDPLWQLLPNQISYAAFEKGNISGGRNGKSISPGDSVDNFLALDPLQQMEAAARRMNTAGVSSEQQKNWYGYNQMNMAIVHGERNMQLYNAAVQELNTATAAFNNFISYRNKMFQPAKPDEDLQQMLTNAKKFLKSAQEKTALIRQSKENFQYDTGDLDYQLEMLSRKVGEQTAFLQTYLATAGPEREKLFYK